jgi:hypothetical protein
VGRHLTLGRSYDTDDHGMKKYGLLAFPLLLMVFVHGCDQEGSAEKAGEKIDNAVEKAGDKAQEKMDEAGDAVEDAMDK